MAGRPGQSFRTGGLTPVIAARTIGHGKATSEDPGPRAGRLGPRRDMTRILLIDDEEQIRLTIGELLRVTGYDVVVAADGQEGLDLFRQHTFDLVITDLLMPKKGGLETIADLRRLKPELKIIATYGGGRASLDAAREVLHA